MLPTANYQAYTENRLLGGNPMELVIALYEGAVEATRQAARCLETGDIWGRSQAVSKATNILTELILSVDERKAPGLGHNLKRLYSYMQARLLEAHVKKTAEPLEEVVRLLTTLLDGWRVVEAQQRQTAAPEPQIDVLTVEAESPLAYGGFLYDGADHFARTAVTL